MWSYVGRFTLILVRIVQLNKEKILFIVTRSIVTMEMVTMGRKIRDLQQQGCYRPLLLYLKVFYP